MLQIVKMTEKERKILISFYERRMDGIKFIDWLPKTGLACYNNGVCIAAMAVYFDSSSPVAVAGWCATEPNNSYRLSYEAVCELIKALPKYCQCYNVKHLLTIFGARSINNILDKNGLIAGDSNVLEKYKSLR